MREFDLSRYVSGVDYTIWPIDFAMGLSFELPLKSVAPLLPPPLVPVQPRPDVALANVILFNFPEKTVGLKQKCAELVLNIHVVPMRRFAPTLPRLAMFTLRLGAETREFIGSPYAVDKYRVFPEPIGVLIDRRNISARVTDGKGRPIVTLSAAQNVLPDYQRDAFFAQSFALSDGVLNVAGNWFEFEVFENQKNLATAGEIFRHEFFGDLDIKNVTSRANYIQMWAKPGSIGCENHFLLRPLLI